MNTFARGEKCIVHYCTKCIFLVYYSDEHFSAGDERVGSKRSNFPPTHTTHVANKSFEAELILELLLTGTHLRKQQYSYSPACTLHPQVAYAILFSAILNDLQAD